MANVDRRRRPQQPAQRLAEHRGVVGLLGKLGTFTFDDAVKGADRVTEAVTLFALLELYKAGEADWEQDAPFAPITIQGRTG